MAAKPITRQEALQYDAQALLADTEKRHNNIKIFEDTIDKERKSIEQFEYILTQIDPNHADVKVLEGNIEKIKANIKTFEDAIAQEKVQIERDLEMIKIIESN